MSDAQLERKFNFCWNLEQAPDAAQLAHLAAA